MEEEKDVVQPLAKETKKNDAIQLKRNMGLFSAVNVILAVMIGSGIFISPSSALMYSGSVGMTLVVWALCGVISLLGALAYAELGTIVPRSGSEYAYFMESFGPLHKFWGRLPAFLYSIIMIFIVKPAEVAVVVLTFSEYLSQPILDSLCVSDPVASGRLKKVIALLALCVITYINSRSVKLYVKITNIFGSFKIIVCFIIIIGGLYELFKGNTQYLERPFDGTNYRPESLALAFYSGLWSYDGWNTVTVITEEVKRPEVNILRSIIIAVPLVTLFYVMMNISYMTVLSLQEMTSVAAVAVTFGEKILGPFSLVIPIGVAISTFTCALNIQFGVTRLCYVAAEDGHMVQSLCFINVNRLTPCPAAVFQGILTFLLILAGGIVELIEFVSFLIWLFYGLAMVSLIVMRRTKMDVHRPYKVPMPVVILTLLVAIYLSSVPLIVDPTPKYLIALLFVGVGIVLYYILIYKGKTPSFMNKATRTLQLLLESVPPEKGVYSD